MTSLPRSSRPLRCSRTARAIAGQESRFTGSW
jgi:hypothetical protein